MDISTEIIQIYDNIKFSISCLRLNLLRRFLLCVVRKKYLLVKKFRESLNLYNTANRVRIQTANRTEPNYV